MNRKLGIIFLASLTAFAACSGGGSSTNPNQTEINQATVDFSATAEAIFEDNFIGVADCADFQFALDNFNQAPVSCDSGTVTITIVSSACDDGPPLFAEATFSVVADNCQDDDFNTFSDGALQLDLDYEGNDLGDFNISTTGIDVNGLNFDFDNFLVTFSAAPNPTCTGKMSVDGDSCTIAADCNSCAF